MRIDSLTNPEAVSPGTSLPNVNTLRSLWRVGAILEAIAVRDVTSGELWLELPNQQRLPARIASGDGQVPEQGQLLKLRVLRDSPVLAMEVIEEGVPDNVAESALRRALPQQSSPGPLLANLGWLARHTEQLGNLPEPVQTRLINLLQALPTTTQLTDAAGLRTALQNSGLYLENKLATLADPAAARAAALANSTRNPQRTLQGDPQLDLQRDLPRDLKALLLDLRDELQRQPLAATLHRQPPGPLPSLATTTQSIPIGPASLAAMDDPHEQLAELKQQIDGNVARLQTNQLLATQAAQQGMLAWLVELPVLTGAQPELVRFKFQREPAAKNAATASAWRVELALDLGQAGNLHASIQWQPSEGINIQLRSDTPALVTRMNQDAALLSASLTSQGIPVQTIRCLHGMPVDAHRERLSALLDLHA